MERYTDRADAFDGLFNMVLGYGIQFLLVGTYPKLPDNQPLSIVNYDDDRRRPVADGRLMAWGELTYAKPLTEKQMEDYELKPAPGNPDRVHPSITARLKEGTRGQKPPKEPGQKRSHKNHE